MSFSFSVGNQGFGGSQLRKKLLKHFSVSAIDIATAGRQFPIAARIDIQSGLESLLRRNAEAELVGLLSPNSHEPLTFAQILGGPHFYVDAGPLQYDEIDIGEAVPIRCLKNGLWIGRLEGLPFAVMLVPGGRFGFGRRMRGDRGCRRRARRQILTRFLSPTRAGDQRGPQLSWTYHLA
jgi:hypothetical protein